MCRYVIVGNRCCNSHNDSFLCLVKSTDVNPQYERKTTNLLRSQRNIEFLLVRAKLKCQKASIKSSLVTEASNEFKCKTENSRKN